jgi:hypothetical protein
MGLYYDGPKESGKLMQFLNTVIPGGYIIVITGIVTGLVINDRVPRKLVHI